MSLSRLIRDSLKRGMRTFRRKKKPGAHDEADSPAGGADAVFEQFVRSENFNEILVTFKQLCEMLSIDVHDPSTVYENIKNRIQTHGAKTLWRLLGKRMAQNVYGKGSACKNTKVLIVGAGPCGLRMAIEAALLGARVTVVEMRDHIARNNVLHLWPFVIHDLKALGARVFSPKFCSGSVEHVSIRRLQHILMKVCLLLGVEIFAPVQFKQVVPPDQSAPVKGWRAQCTPEDHVVNEYEFDMVVGADGKTNTLKDFKRKVFRGKLAIAITANFKNYGTREESSVAEIPGLFYIFNPEFFLKLRNEASIDLENFVYFKDDTHYFVMTARKQSLLKRGVLKQDKQDVASLLDRDNVNRQALLEYAKEAANLATDFQIPNLDFALNHKGQEDAAIFDFTSMHQAEHSSMMFEREGKKLLMAIVGDTLIEPFWPTGSGCARGFLSVFDTAWMMRSHCKPDKVPLQVIAERESVFQLLSQTKPDNLARQLSNYTIDPRTRYGGQVNQEAVKPAQVRHLLVSSEARLPSVNEVPRPQRYVSRRKSGKMNTLDTKRLLSWYQDKLKPYNDKVTVTDLTTSWRDGVALCCLIHLYRPEIIDLRGIREDNPVGNNQLAFGIVQQEFGIMPVQSPAEVARAEGPDRLACLSYLTRLQDQLQRETPVITAEDKPRTRKRDLLKRKVSSVGMLLKMSKRRKPEAKPPIPRKPALRHLPVPRMTGASLTPPVENRPTSWQEKRAKIPPPADTNRPVSWQDKRTSTLDQVKRRGLAAKRITLFEQGVQPEELCIPETAAPSSDCCVCGRHLLVVERQSAHGYFFHRRCFRCATCGCSLWLGASTARRGVNDKVHFYCDRHDPAAASAGYDEPDAAVITEEANGAESALAEQDEGAAAEEVDDYVSGMMRMMGLMGVSEASARGVMGMSDTWTPAICEADVSSSDYDSDDEVLEDPFAQSAMDLLPTPAVSDVNTATASGADASRTGTGRRRQLYPLATSMRLLVAHEVQRELEDVQREEEELQEEGREMENTLRRKSESGVDKEKLTDEWIDVVKSKQDVQNHQSVLMLRGRLLDLQSKFNSLQRDLFRIQSNIEESDMTRASLDTERVEAELTDVFTELREIRVHLQVAGETSV